MRLLSPCFIHLIANPYVHAGQHFKNSWIANGICRKVTHFTKGLLWSMPVANAIAFAVMKYFSQNVPKKPESLYSAVKVIPDDRLEGVGYCMLDTAVHIGRVEKNWNEPLKPKKDFTNDPISLEKVKRDSPSEKLFLEGQLLCKNGEISQAIACFNAMIEQFSDRRLFDDLVKTLIEVDNSLIIQNINEVENEDEKNNFYVYFSHHYFEKGEIEEAFTFACKTSNALVLIDSMIEKVKNSKYPLQNYMKIVDTIVSLNKCSKEIKACKKLEYINLASCLSYGKMFFKKIDISQYTKIYKEDSIFRDIILICYSQLAFSQEFLKAAQTFNMINWDGLHSFEKRIPFKKELYDQALGTQKSCLKNAIRDKEIDFLHLIYCLEAFKINPNIHKEILNTIIDQLIENAEGFYAKQIIDSLTQEMQLTFYPKLINDLLLKGRELTRKNRNHVENEIFIKTFNQEPKNYFKQAIKIAKETHEWLKHSENDMFKYLTRNRYCFNCDSSQSYFLQLAEAALNPLLRQKLLVNCFINYLFHQSSYTFVSLEELAKCVDDEGLIEFLGKGFSLLMKHESTSPYGLLLAKTMQANERWRAKFPTIEKNDWKARMIEQILPDLIDPIPDEPPIELFVEHDQLRRNVFRYNMR